jgi:TRAP-type C4-dicarboxylate transport system substrate-binding protein
MRCISLGMAVALGISLLATSANAEPVKLKFAFFTNEKERTWTTTLKPFIDAVNAEGKDVVEIQAFPDGALGRNMTQQAQLLLDGVADIAFVLPALTPGRFAENEVMELPGAVRDLRDATRVYWGMINAGKIRGFEDFHFIAALGGDPFPLNMRLPISGLADLKGKKIRAGGAFQTKTLKALDMVPVLIPISEAAEAIARGTVDGVAIQPVPMVDFGVARVVNYHYFAGIGFAPLTVLMSKKKFDSMPKAAQDIIVKFGGDWMADLYNRNFGAVCDEVVKSLEADPKRKVIYPTPAEQQQLNAAFKVVIDEWTAQSPRHAELYRDLQDVQKQVRAGK